MNYYSIVAFDTQHLICVHDTQNLHALKMLVAGPLLNTWVPLYTLTTNICVISGLCTWTLNCGKHVTMGYAYNKYL